MSLPRQSAAVFALALTLPCSLVRADAISEPSACPPGAQGRSAHEGQWCEPWPCESDAECDGGRCVPWRVCTRVATVVPGGLWPEPPPPRPRTLVVGTCDPARACTGTEEPPPSVVGTFEGVAPPSCAEARYCVPAALPAFPGRSTAAEEEVESSAEATDPPARTSSARNCGCRAGATSMGGGAIALASIALALRRRR